MTILWALLVYLVLARLSKAVMAIALACSIGLHWGFLQSLAWMGMVITYSQDATLKVAFTKTFDGKHPCALCKEIAKGKTSEKKSDSPLPVKKFEYLDARVRFIFTAPTSFWDLCPTDDFLTSLLHAPATPPPRGFFA